MSRPKIVLVLGIVALAAAVGISWYAMDGGGSGRGGGGSNRPVVKASGQAKAAAPGANEFGFRLFNELVKGKEQQNLAVSGLSAAIALALFREGCEGPSRKCVGDALGYPGNDTGESARAYADLLALLNGRTEATVRTANAVVVKPGLVVEPAFLKTAQELFQADVSSRDLMAPETRQSLNDWASRQTDGMIPELMGDVNEETFAVLLNALYFAGEWEVKFAVGDTEPADFHPETGEPFKVPMMSGKVEAAVRSYEDFGAARLPYKGKDYSMVLMLPHEGKTLADVRAGLTQAKWAECLEELEYYGKETRVSLPKFRISTRGELTKALENVGLRDAIEVGKADYSRLVKGMAPPEPVYGTVFQQAVVEVDESGTKAAAVTEFHEGVKSAMPDFIPNFNRPFMFAVVEHQTGAILFLGQVHDPRKE